MSLAGDAHCRRYSAQAAHLASPMAARPMVRSNPRPASARDPPPNREMVAAVAGAPVRNRESALPRRPAGRPFPALPHPSGQASTTAGARADPRLPVVVYSYVGEKLRGQCSRKPRVDGRNSASIKLDPRGFAPRTPLHRRSRGPGPTPLRWARPWRASRSCDGATRTVISALRTT